MPKTYEVDAKIEVDGKTYNIKVIAPETLNIEFVREKHDEIRPFLERMVKFGKTEIHVDEILKEFQTEDEYDRNRFEKTIKKSSYR